MASEFGSSPWPWLLGGSLGLGLALGLLARALAAGLRGRRRAATRRSILGFVALALAVLCGAAFLVLPGKSELADAALAPVGLVVALLALLGGLFPRAAGIPLFFLGSGLAILVVLGLDGWLRAGGVSEIATITPYSVASSGFRGELSLRNGDSLSTIQRLELPSDEAGLAIERIALSGPLSLAGATAFYRVSGVVGREGQATAILEDFPLASPLLDAILPLGSEAGASASAPFVSRWREVTEPVALSPLVSLHFTLDVGARPGLRLSAATESGRQAR